MTERGKFIVFEGVGGCGKTTQIRKAETYLVSKGVDVLITREPGGVDASEKIRELIFKLKADGVANADHQMALFFAARCIWLDALVKPAVEKGKVVLSDRYDSSTNAYQGWAEGGNRKTIERFSEIVSNGFKPDAVLLIRVNEDTAMKRKSADTEGDPFDSESKDYFSRLVNGYDDMAKNNWRGIKWFVVDGEKPIKEVSDAISVILDKITEVKNGR